ncbi:MAG: MmgE/PrpD family protein [Pseudomonadota bacterium]
MGSTDPLNWSSVVLDAAPDHARQALRRSMLDLAGVAVAGARTELSQIVRDHAALQFGGTGARLMLDGRRVSAAGAAFAGGMTIDAMDAHDGLKPVKGHIGCGVFPAALAFAQAESLDLTSVFDLTLLGYELGARAGLALHSTAPDYHTSGAWVAVAIAGMGARALGLTAEQTAHALGIAEYHGPRSQMMRCIDHPTMVKDGSGWGAMAGVTAAYLARAGFTGAPALTVTTAQVADIWEDLGTRWYVSEQYFKPQPVCRWAQPAITAALALQAAHGLEASDIARVDVTTFHEAVRLATAHPTSTEAAQYSLPFPVAAALVSGQVGPEQIDGPGLLDDRAQALAGRVHLHEAEAFNAAFPARRFAQVEITVQNGRQFRTDPMEAPGDPEAPLTDGELLDKFEAYADPLGAARKRAIKAALWHGEGTLRQVVEALCMPIEC